MGTDKSKEIYDFIIEYIELIGYAPSVKEISEAVNLKSTSSVRGYLKQLCETGLLEIEIGEPRAIKATGYKFVKSNEILLTEEKLQFDMDIDKIYRQAAQDTFNSLIKAIDDKKVNSLEELKIIMNNEINSIEK